jgi:hypothetical protein
MEVSVQKKDPLARLLALIGTVLVWLPIAVMVISSILGLIRSGMFNMDYLLPAEVAPVPLFGSLLLWWAALRVHFKRSAIGWGMMAAAVFLVGSQFAAVVTGLASSDISEGGWQMFLVLGALIAYDLALAWIGITGIQLLRESIKRSRQTAPVAEEP